MNSISIYPSKVRFYSTGRWENWNKFRSSSTFTKNHGNITRIREASLSSTDDPFISQPSEFQSNLNKPIKLKVLSLAARQVDGPKSIPKVPISENLPEKYTYSSFFNKFDVCGKPVSTMGNARIKARQKKTKNLYFKLPVVKYPSRIRKDTDWTN